MKTEAGRTPNTAVTSYIMQISNPENPILIFQGCENLFLGYNSVQCDVCQLTFRRNTSIPSSGWKKNPRKTLAGNRQSSACSLFQAYFLLGLLFDSQDRGSILFRNVGKLNNGLHISYPKDGTLLSRVIKVLKECGLVDVLILTQSPK